MRSRALFFAFATCALLSLLPLLATYRLPMTDLPQHAAQITFWAHRHDPCYAFDRQYELNLLTPYFGAYAPARLLAALMPVNAAFKIVIALAIAALPLSLLMLTRRAGLDDWLALLGFPLAFGFNFYWGFVNTMIALPLAIVFIGVAYDYAREQTLRRAIAVALLAIAVAMAHALIFAVALCAAGAMHLTSTKSIRRLVITSIPYVAPLPALALWWSRVSAHERMRVGTVWALSPKRLLIFFSDLLSAGFDRTAVAVSAILIVAVIVTGLRPSRELRRWIPAAAFGAAYFLAPSIIRGTSFINERFAVLFAVSLLLAFDAGRPLVRRELARTIIVAAVAAWSLVLVGRFTRFQQESRDFDRLVDALPTNAGVAYLDLAPYSTAISGYPYVQYAAYYQERKGGLISWSFANNFQVVMRYRPGVEIRVTPGLYLDGRRFRWGTNDSRHEYFLVRAPGDAGRFLFREATEPIVLHAHEGAWWVYRRASTQPRSTCPPLAPDGDEARKPVIDLTR